MATLKRKTSSGWETVTGADGWPASIPVQITEVDADLVPLSVTANGNYTPQAPHNGFSSVSVNVSSGGGIPSPIAAGDTPIWQDKSFASRNSTTMGVVGNRFTCERAGTYRFWFSVGMAGTSNFSADLYKNNTAQSATNVHSVDSNYIRDFTKDIQLNVGDYVEVWCKCRSQVWLTGFTASINWDNTF